jgi:hypothetical protein
MKRCIALLLATASAPTLAAAQDFSGDVTLGFGQHVLEELDLSTLTLDGRISLAFDNGITLGVKAGYLDLSVQDADLGGVDGGSVIDGQFVGLDLGYRFDNSLSVGTYFEQMDIGIISVPVDLSIESVGLTAGYSTETLEFGAFIGQTTTSPDIFMTIVDGASGLDNMGITATYAPMQNLTVGAALVRTTLSGAGESLNIDVTGLAAAFDVTEQISLFGGVSRITITEGDIDFTTVGIGGAYDLTDLVGIASSVSLELAQSSDEIDTIRFGLTFPLGGKGSEAPLNSVADSVFNPRHGALNAALNSVF